MVSKKEIIKYLTSIEKFEHIDKISNIFSDRVYFVEVTSRSKEGWTHVFYNYQNDKILKFNRYYMTLYGPDNYGYEVKLNKNNKSHIKSLIVQFLNISYE